MAATLPPLLIPSREAMLERRRQRSREGRHDRGAEPPFCVYINPMGKRRRKPGRPRTGHDPVVTVRLPAVVIGRIDKMAAALNADRSLIIRMGMESLVQYGSYETQAFRKLLIARLQGRGGRGRTKAGRIAADYMDGLVALSKAYLAARKRQVGAKRKVIARQPMLGGPSKPRFLPGGSKT
jgi:predicted transcriptional regulator